MPEDFYTCNDIVKLTNYSARTIRKFAYTDKFTTAYKIRGWYLIKKDDPFLRKLIKAKEAGIVPVRVCQKKKTSRASKPSKKSSNRWALL